MSGRTKSLDNQEVKAKTMGVIRQLLILNPYIQSGRNT